MILDADPRSRPEDLPRSIPSSIADKASWPTACASSIHGGGDEVLQPCREQSLHLAFSRLLGQPVKDTPGTKALWREDEVIGCQRAYFAGRSVR
jgi:hypothetical protein